MDIFGDGAHQNRREVFKPQDSRFLVLLLYTTRGLIPPLWPDTHQSIPDRSLPIMENARSNHTHNPSINSLGSIVEPLTPPDLGEQFTFPQSHFSTGSGNTPSGSTTPLSTLNSNIGGNTFRSRFKSLPLVTELDHQFNQFNINSLQKLSKGYTPSPGSSSSASTNSIPQIPLQQYQYQNSQSEQELQFRRLGSQTQLYQLQGGQQRQQHQQHQSLPSIHFQQGARRESSVSSSIGPAVTTTSNFKNYDELNLIPIDKLDILKLSVDQYGCRFLQKKLEMDNSIKDIIFNKVFNNMIELIVDPFGNYLVQKLVDYLSTYQKNMLIEKIHAYLFLISINQYGTRSLQKIIDKVTNTYQMDLIIKGLQMNDTTSAIEDNNIVKLIKDLNGNHVIQKCIFKFPSEKFQFVIDAICLHNNIVRISTHKHGCCVLQKLLNNANFDQILKISHVLLLYLDELINDQFGNYIIQFLFELDFLKSSSKIDFLVDEFFSKIYKGLVQLSCLKFSSNVIEKFIKILKIKNNFFYLSEIIKVTNANFEILIKDKFGNYVIQTLIDLFYDVSELSIDMNVLVNTVKNYLPAIKAAPYARKIQLKIQQLESNYNTNQFYLQGDTQQMAANQAGFVKQANFMSINPMGMNGMNAMNNNTNNLNMSKMNMNISGIQSTPYPPYVSNPYIANGTPSFHQNNNNHAFIPEADYFNHGFINPANMG